MKRRYLAPFILTATAIVGAAYGVQNSRPVYISVQGDDGLTQRIVGGVLAGVQASGQFTLADGQKAGTLYVFIGQARPQGFITLPVAITSVPALDLNSNSAPKIECQDVDACVLDVLKLLQEQAAHNPN